MEFIDPIANVGEKELADAAGTRPIEIDGLAPFVLIAIGKIPLRELLKAVPAVAKVVVNDVEQDADAHGVRLVHKPAKVVWPAIQPRRSKQVHPVVAPAKRADKFIHRHHFQQGNTEVGQFIQPARRRIPGPFGRKCADVQFIEDSRCEWKALPMTVGPPERGVID